MKPKLICMECLFKISESFHKKGGPLEWKDGAKDHFHRAHSLNIGNPLLPNGKSR